MASTLQPGTCWMPRVAWPKRTAGRLLHVQDGVRVGETKKRTLLQVSFPEDDSTIGGVARTIFLTQLYDYTVI